MSCQIYQENCIITTKLVKANLSLTFLLLTLHHFLFLLQIDITEYVTFFNVFFRDLTEETLYGLSLIQIAQSKGRLICFENYVFGYEKRLF
jgi:hypothetical protein